MESHIQSLVDWFSAHPYGALGAVFAAALLEAVAVIGTVIPGSSIVFVGGVLIGLGALNPWITAGAALAGAILGDGVSYWLGRRYHERIRTMWPMRNHPALFVRGRAYFEANGGKSVFIGRFLGPLRAIVPVVAGMADMPPARFYVVNVLSALAWCAAHLVPGVLFGATLQVAGAVSSRLAILLVIFALLLWAVTVLFRFLLSRVRPHMTALRDRAVARARKRRGLASRVVLSLLDPTRPESAALLTAAILLIGSAWIFLGILEDVVSKDPLIQVDRTIYEMLQHLRTQWADSVMVTVTGLGGAAGTVPVIIAVAALLAWKRCWRTLGYWLAAAGFAQAFVWMLKYVLGRARPHDVYTGFEQFSFPSGHAASSIVVYGFLAFLLARGKPIGARFAIAVAAGLVIVLVSFSRLYLGAHWFSDVAASLSFGLAWVSVLGIAYTVHVRDEPLRAAPLALVALTTLALVGGSYVGRHHAAEMVRYEFRPSARTITLDEWRAGGWRSLPVARSELGAETEERFSLQWAGGAQEIARALAAQGWTAPRAWTARAALLWLLPAPPIEQLPVLPKLDRGEPQRLTLVKVLAADERAVIRLWPSRYAIGSGSAARPIWNGFVSLERLRHPARVITIASTAPEAATPMRTFEQDARASSAHVERRERSGAVVLLVW